ncbi:MAG: hypothetical protein EBT75_02490 [Proteobacteria bacterium]|nr:hypothetical protein [Pseudomonadota bacterium]NBS49687.1 hypothetical protein [Verrucomicrobiota bacterium]
MNAIGPDVEYLNNREPWGVPQYIPPSPHNLPIREVPQATTATVDFTGATINTRTVYNYASLVSVTVSVGTASFKFLDAPIGKRNMLGFRNAGATNLYIDFNANATSNSWLALASGVLLLFDSVVPQDDLYVISDAAGGVLAYAYSTFPG